MLSIRVRCVTAKHSWFCVLRKDDKKQSQRSEEKMTRFFGIVALFNFFLYFPSSLFSFVEVVVFALYHRLPLVVFPCIVSNIWIFLRHLNRDFSECEPQIGMKTLRYLSFACIDHDKQKRRKSSTRTRPISHTYVYSVTGSCKLHY